MANIDYTKVLPNVLTQQAVTEYIKSKLGAPRRVIELDEFQWASCISDALDMYNMYKAREIYGYYPHLSGRVSIPITNTEVYDVTQVDFLYEMIVDYENLNVFELDFRIKNLKGGAGDYFEYRMIREMNKRAFSSEADWTYNTETRTLHLSANGGPYLVQYTMVIPFKLGNIPRNYFHLYMKAVESFAKLRLFEMRSKTPLLLPGGPEKYGENLKVEAEADLELVRTKLQEPSAPVFG